MTEYAQGFAAGFEPSGSLRIELIHPDTMMYPDTIVFSEGVLVDATGTPVRLSDVVPAIRELTAEESSRAVKATLTAASVTFPNLVAAGVDVPLAVLLALKKL